jgi:ADP-heptose:LPS heptosyltransferase
MFFGCTDGKMNACSVRGFPLSLEVSSASFATKLREMTGPYRAKNPLLVAGLYAADAISRLLPKRQQGGDRNGPLRLVVANWGHLGDVVTILPLLKFLERHPRVQELGVLIGSWSRGVLESSDIKVNIHVIDHWALDRSQKSKARKIAAYMSGRPLIVHELRHFRYDMSIDTFVSFPSTHGIMWSASIPSRVGFTSGGLGPCLTNTLEWIPDDRTMLDHQLDLLGPLLGDAYPRSLHAAYPGFESPVPEELLSIQKPYIVIHMGQPDIKGWIPEKWLALAVALKSRGFDLVTTGGPGRETEEAHNLNQGVTVLNLAGRASWNEFIATVANAAAVISIDSVTGHIAACFGVPAVVLTTGRTHLNLWRPNDSRATALIHPVGCAPCFRTSGCPTMACVRYIEVEDVLRSLDELLDTKAVDKMESIDTSTSLHGET